MTTTSKSLITINLLLMFSFPARAECSDLLGRQIVSAERIIDSLRPDKAGQMRTFAVDGSEYTAGQANWMKSQLRLITRACANGDESSASSHLREITTLLKAHQHSS